MSELLNLAIEAHGGFDRWQQLKKISARCRVGGVVWHVKQCVGAFADVHFTMEPHHPHTEYLNWPSAQKSGVFEPRRTSILSESGTVIDVRESPRDVFSGHILTTPWDQQNSLYFASYAMWNYLSAPFLFKLAGFKAEEIEPWDEDGQKWRRLKVTFPPEIPSHCAEQVFYFDEAGILQRHDYSVDIMGGTSSAHYVSKHKVFGGIVFPTERRVYSKTPDNKPMLERVAVSIDIDSVELS